MPQIANQDYNLIRPAYAEYLFSDAEALGLLAGHLERGTIFDVILKWYNSFSRVVSFFYDGINDTVITVLDSEDSSTGAIYLLYTATQYSGLAAVQRACELTEELPKLAIDESDYLIEDTTGKLICVDGKKVLTTLDEEDHIAMLEVTDIAPGIGEEFVNISYDDLQKLIGIITV